MASHARRGNLSNASRSLHALIHRKNKTLPIPITSVTTPIRLSRRRKVMERPWPVLHLSDWLRVGFNNPYDGFYFLGGLKMDNLKSVESMLDNFWKKNAYMEGDAPSYPKRTFPFMLHGDEGRGLAKRPLLVVSFQPVIGWTGGDNVNSTKYLGDFELIFSCDNN